MKFYIAASNQERAKIVARCLQLAGHSVVSQWLRVPFTRTRQMSVEERQGVATMCFGDIQRADMVVLLDDEGPTPGGKHVEVGYAIGIRKPVIVIGRRENCMLWFPAVGQVESISELIAKVTR